MANYVNVDHLKFLLREVHGIDDVLALSRFSDYDIDSVEMLLDAAKTYGDQELYPYFTEMDRVGGKFENGTITCHPHIRRVMELSGENGYICSHFDYEDGGSQMPHMASLAANFITTAANNSAVGYPGLTAGAAGLIKSFGSKEQFDTFVPKMMAGKWGGTMALTEPSSGSSLANIGTSAKLNEDGTYHIDGQKIFISAGDHQCADNIIHLTLARIEGAPEGTKGISLFIVPKKRIENGELVPNDVTTAGEFEKMGQRGYVTTHLVFGDKGDCKGHLVGEPNRGLKYMFQMMNGARLEVGLTAAAIASGAYQASLQYAKERPQGRKLTNANSKINPNDGQTLIINHPDVRRMLMLQKSVVDGSMSLLTLCGKYLDFSHYAETLEERERYHNLLEFLTPIAKTYPSEMGRVSTSNGMQVLGGYGFTTDFPLEQYYRDIRITAIYEGTTGIQSLDLLGRKAMMKNGAVILDLMKEINKDIEQSETYDELKPYATILKDKLQLVQKVLSHLMQFAMKGDYERFLADATAFMEMTSNIIIGWQWIKMASAAKQAIITDSMIRPVEFYEAQIHTMKFYFKYEIPKTSACAEILLSNEALTLVEEGKEAKVFA